MAGVIPCVWIYLDPHIHPTKETHCDVITVNCEVISEYYDVITVNCEVIRVNYEVCGDCEVIR
jgi:hypothetical protein